MLILAAIFAVTPIDVIKQMPNTLETELSFAVKRKKRKAIAGSGRKFGSCKAARKAGYTHMRRGQTGYSGNLDRDGDGIACEKVK